MLGLVLVMFSSLGGFPPASTPSPHFEFLEENRQSPSFLESYSYSPFKDEHQPIAAEERFDGIVFGYLPYWADLDAEIPWEHLTHLAYFSVEMNSDGSLGSDHGWESHGEALVQSGRHHGVKVVLTATYMDNEGIRALLANPVSRQRAIDNLLDKVQAIGGQGINIDFEFVPAAATGESPSPKENFVTFIRDLSMAFHTAIPGSHVSLATPAIDWNGSFDYDALAVHSDGLMIMGYGYHWKGGNPGPVAPLASGSTWGTHNLTWTIADYKEWGLEENSHKFILGLPLYGRDWPSENHSIPGQATGTGRAISLSICDGSWGDEKRWDEDAQTPYKLYFEDDTPRQRFCEDTFSMEAKFELIQSQNIGGVMFWDLGKINAGHPLWNTVDSFFKKPAPPSEPSPSESERNESPEAYILTIPTGFVETTLLLDGQQSSDPNNDELTYTWELLSEQNPLLSRLDSPILEFQGREIGDYSFRLTVSDGALQHSAYATITLTQPPSDTAGSSGCQSAPSSIWILILGTLLFFKRRMYQHNCTESASASIRRAETHDSVLSRL